MGTEVSYEVSYSGYKPLGWTFQSLGGNGGTGMLSLFDLNRLIMLSSKDVDRGGQTRQLHYTCYIGGRSWPQRSSVVLRKD